MALQISYNSEQGFTAPSAYARIDGFRGTKDSIDVQIQYYYNAAAMANWKQPIGYGNFQLDIANGATLSQIYTALKLLPEFADSIDV